MQEKGMVKSIASKSDKAPTSHRVPIKLMVNDYGGVVNENKSKNSFAQEINEQICT